MRLGPLLWRRRPAFCWVSPSKVYRRGGVALGSLRTGRASRCHRARTHASRRVPRRTTRTQDTRDQQLRLDAGKLAEPAPEGLEALSADMIGIDDSVRMYLNEIGMVALLTADEEVVLAKAIELGEQMVDEPWKGIVSLHEWTTHDTERKTRTAKPQHRLPFGPDAHTMVRDAVCDVAAADLLAPSPDLDAADRKSGFSTPTGSTRRSSVALGSLASSPTEHRSSAWLA